MLLFMCFTYSNTDGLSFAENIYWAKIEKQGVEFYATEDLSSALFNIPNSYFVKLLGEDENFYIAQYQDIHGYVKKSDVTPMDGTPAVPYFQEDFRAFIPTGTGLYTKTEMNESYKIATIPYLYEELIFYGSILGDTAIPDKSNEWHYCKFQDEVGYVYSAFCDKLSPPPTNTETFPIIEDLSFEKQSPPTLSSTAMTFIIIGVSLPCLIVLYLLTKPNSMKVKTQQEKEKYKSKRRKDYFEFDPSDLN